MSWFNPAEGETEEDKLAEEETEGESDAEAEIAVAEVKAIVIKALYPAVASVTVVAP